MNAPALTVNDLKGIGVNQAVKVIIKLFSVKRLYMIPIQTQKINHENQ